MVKSEYRSDIDGLRAIAVILVVIFHAGFSFIPGGFVGVDVFFVISGFLITGIIHKELENNRFSFAHFYKRRIRRLMPALFAVIMITSLFAVFILLPSDLASYGKSVISVVLSMSNFYFWRENGGYFGGNVQEVLLLHTWSLSVEEQYYLLWPLFLVMTAKYLKHKFYLWTLAAITVASVFFSQWVSEITFGAAYYLLPTRAFELLIGSLLALSWNRLPLLSPFLLNVLSALGLGLILGAAIILNESSNFPGFNALIPTIGTALLLYTGRSNKPLVNRLLSLSPIVWLGLTSYSLYLWHWPIVVFIRYIGFELTATVSSLIVITSVLTGWLSWKFVETPFRYAGKSEFKVTFQKLYLAPTVAAIAMGLGITMTNGLSERFDSEIIRMEKAVASKPVLLREGCHSPSRSSKSMPNENCQLGYSENPKASALLIGDSHSNHLTGFMSELAVNSNMSLMDYTLDECVPIFDLKWGHNPHYSKVCKERNDFIQDYIQQKKFDYVLLAGYWPTLNGYSYVYTDDDRHINKSEFLDLLISKLRYTIEKVEQTGAKAVLIKDIAPNGHKSPKCEIKKRLFNDELNCNIKMAKVDKRDSMINEVFAMLAKNYPSLILIDPKEAMCDKEYCYSFLNNTPLFLDKSHLNDMGSHVLGRRYLQLSENPFL